MLVDLAAASQRQMSQAAWFNAVVCAAAAEASATDDDADENRPGWVADHLVSSALNERYIRSAHVADVALACGTSAHVIWNRVHHARALTERLPAVEALHASGVLDVRKTQVITEAIHGNAQLRPDQVHRLDEVLAGRPDPMTPNPENGQTPPRAIRPILDLASKPPAGLSQAINRRVHALAGPRCVDAAHEQAKAACIGVRTSALPDGMASLILTGTAIEVWTIAAALEAVTDGSGEEKVAAVVAWAKNAFAGLINEDAGTAMRPHIVVTVPADTLAWTLEPEPTHDSSSGAVPPAEMAGYGPIPFSAFRDLARNATWRCGAVDPVTGQLIALGHHTYTDAYTAPPRLRRFLSVSWQTCTFPGCTKRADRCELDHTENWPSGKTCECNLNPLCRPHHNVKTHTAWTVKPATDPAHPPGTRQWTSPTGRIYHTHHGITEIGPGVRQELTPGSPISAPPDDPGDPPF